MKVKNHIFTLFFFIVGITPALFTFFLYRRTKIVSDEMTFQINGSLYIVYLLLIIVAALYSTKIINVEWDKTLLLLLGLLFLFTGPLLAQIFSMNPAINAKLMIVFSSYLLIYLYKDYLTLDYVINIIRYILLFYIYGSIVAVFIVPNVAVDFNYWQSLFSFFQVRLNGIANHANSLAPLIFIYIIIDYYYPKKNQFRYVHLSLGFLCLLFTQSKSTIILLMAFYLILLSFKFAKKYKGSKKKILIRKKLLNLYIPLGVIIIALVPFINKFLKLLESKYRLFEFTGRNLVWDATIIEWQGNPIFGYGLNLWGNVMQEKYEALLGWTPGHAHSQFFQTLGESGLVGVIGLVLYLMILIYITWKTAKPTKGFTLVLFFFLLFRGITEPVFVNTTDNVGYLIHFMILTLFMAIIVDQNKRKQDGLDLPVREEDKFTIHPLTFLIYIVAFTTIMYAFMDLRTFANPLIPFNITKPLQYFLSFGIFVISLAMFISSKGKLHANSRLVITGAALLFIFAGILASFFGHNPEIRELIFVEFLLFFSIYFVKDMDLDTFAESVKKVLLIFIYGTVVMAIAFPLWSFKIDYDQGLLDFFNIRLYGLTTNPNNTASLLLIYFLLEMQFPTKSRLRMVHIILSLGIVFLTQSKTVWALLVLFFVVKLVVGNWDKIRKSIWLKITPMIVLGLIAFLFVYKGPALLQPLQTDHLTNLTGRTFIWNLTLEEWENNKIFGYGLGLWDGEMFEKYKDQVKPGWTFSHAHNQFVQSLGESGIIGLGALILYILVFLYYGMKYARETKGISILFAIYPILRGWTEPVFRHHILDINFFIHIIIYSYFILLVKKKKEDSKTSHALSEKI